MTVSKTTLYMLCMCMCAGVCIWMCVLVHTYSYIGGCVYICVLVHASMCVCGFACAYAC